MELEFEPCQVLTALCSFSLVQPGLVASSLDGGIRYRRIETGPGPPPENPLSPENTGNNDDSAFQDAVNNNMNSGCLPRI